MRFANNRNHFIELDDALDRVRRKTLEEWEEENEIPLSDSCFSSDDSESESDEEEEEAAGTEKEEDTVGDILNEPPASSFSNKHNGEYFDVAMALETDIIAPQKYLQSESEEQEEDSSSLSSLSDEEEEDDSTLQWDEETDDEEMDELALKDGDSDRMFSKAYQDPSPSYDDMEVGEDADDLDDI